MVKGIVAKNDLYQTKVIIRFGTSLSDKMSAVNQDYRPAARISKKTESDRASTNSSESVLDGKPKINKKDFIELNSLGEISKGLLAPMRYERYRRGLSISDYTWTTSYYDNYFSGDGPDGNKKKMVASEWNAVFNTGITNLTPAALDGTWSDAHGFPTHSGYYPATPIKAMVLPPVINFTTASAPSSGIAITSSTKMTIELFNSIIKKFEDIGEVCICNCNYCTCNCNYCTCNCNYACTCNCNY